MRAKPGPALAVLFLINTLNFYDRLALGAILEPLRHEFKLTDAQLGGLVTWFTVVLALAGLPLGRLADTGSRRRLLACGVAVWAGLTGLAALASSYAMLLVTRLGVGVGEAVCAPVAASWIADLVPAERRSRAMAGFMMAIPVGSLLSFSITGPVAQAWGWRVALAIAAAPVLVLAPAVLWLREPEREPSGELRSPDRPQKAMTSPTGFWWIAASGAVINFALYAFSTFLPAFLTRYHGLSVARAGVWMGIGVGAAGIGGGAAAAFLGDRVRSRLGLCAAVSLVSAAPMFAAIRMPAGSAAQSMLLATGGYGLLQMYYGLVYPVIQGLVAPELRARTMAAYLVVSYLGGASWGPLATGRLSDMLARQAAGMGPITEAARAAGLHEAMYVIPCLAVVLSGVLWMALGSFTASHRSA